jgi:hypothetical protein
LSRPKFFNFNYHLLSLDVSCDKRNIKLNLVNHYTIFILQKEILVLPKACTIKSLNTEAKFKKLRENMVHNDTCGRALEYWI